MASSNPALNEKVFQREIERNGSARPGPGWGSPADEVPPGLFGGGGRRPGASTLPPPPGRTPGPTWQPPAPPTGPVGTGGDTMRLGGTLSAAAVLLGFLVVAGWFGWQAVTTTEVQTARGVETSFEIPGWIWGALIGALVLAVVTIFKPKVARITAPLYAVAEGLVVGAISHAYEAQYEGIVLQAVGLTIGVFVMMLVLYASGTVRVTDKLRKGIFAATGAVMLVYLVSIVLRLFGADIPMIHESGPVGILFSLVVVGIAASNLLLDFDFIERGVQVGAPRYMEWYGAFGLMVTLVWLYLELLRLLSKLRER
ncbi:MAG TPA: Bax inhibitor-1/YccA family protein [Aquihabitans sp.]|jgi:uncharacterized YccA/Bax inhibitor family protein|nr:Bax inhibitor-1/YccA family protein [Aquihabitans sp.]